ncbi:hypothetical protein IM697_04210 [Streptomyces ferrugineus]|uniref:Uncharacterized protein n=1 Tax=Streptomyces ferrugineus TaxID=1413221 RepID=A0A7M2SQW7_9ACTN|nr:hypothetical protein [Streptomyces ferrugineus]QOV37641.1 hypothetical protein IM697_04210 [Streptomyces ferrugineus]
MQSIPATLNLPALATAYEQARERFAYYAELAEKGDPGSILSARYLLLGWSEVWDLFNEVGLPVGDVDAVELPPLSEEVAE